jgi:hypothetical protein
LSESHPERNLASPNDSRRVRGSEFYDDYPRARESAFPIDRPRTRDSV